jgi:hypothetical protein
MKLGPQTDPHITLPQTAFGPQQMRTSTLSSRAKSMASWAVVCTELNQQLRDSLFPHQSDHSGMCSSGLLQNSSAGLKNAVQEVLSLLTLAFAGTLETNCWIPNRGV